MCVQHRTENKANHASNAITMSLFFSTETEAERETEREGEMSGEKDTRPRARGNNINGCDLHLLWCTYNQPRPQPQHSGPPQGAQMNNRCPPSSSASNGAQHTHTLPTKQIFPPPHVLSEARSKCECVVWCAWSFVRSVVWARKERERSAAASRGHKYVMR